MFKNTIGPSFRALILFTLLAGVLYPLVVTGACLALFPDQANGSLIKKDGKVVGSKLIGQGFETAAYVWARPSGIGNNPAPSSATNMGPTHQGLADAVAERNAHLLTTSATLPIPSDLLFASGSGVDPHLSLEGALFQSHRVAAARNVPEKSVQNLMKAMAFNQSPFGAEPKLVNVLELNLALDKEFPVKPVTINTP